MSSKKENRVAEQMIEYLLTEMSLYAARSCQPSSAATVQQQPPQSSAVVVAASGGSDDHEAARTVASEMAAAKLERLGAAVGYRFTERLAEGKTWNAAGTSTTSQDAAARTATQQLEAVKFLCKEVWTEIFAKQIDKLQTNHRGVFVLKDLELTWLTRFPSATEGSRVAAIRLLAFPCGVIRGALANLGIPSVVSCDFLADGQNMAACSFNIKVK